ncbi:MAG: hypothetical protein CBD88_08020 [Flavobacteriales bacterium TMED228]|nr:MAG: hypothetical protein CBD88_08020 [Flavobacteriales bacterium TMED228]|tara:strand:- start:32 stop:280 length:249 start_codon:yes stop_codon:yes gene_type:complete
MANTLNEFRSERDAALQASDCLYLPDLQEQLNLDDASLSTLDIYRQQLRDATEGVTDDNAADAALPKPVDPSIAAFLKIELP